MKSYSLKLSDREEGPYGETQIAQMFADGRIDRNTPCKPADRGDWKTIDDYLSMLKYGTKLPPSAAFLLRNRHRFCGTLLQIALRNKYRQTK